MTSRVPSLDRSLALLLLVPPVGTLAQNITGTKIIGGTGTPDYRDARGGDHRSEHQTRLRDSDVPDQRRSIGNRFGPEITDSALTGGNSLDHQTATPAKRRR